jgi:hypothetical protein
VDTRREGPKLKIRIPKSYDRVMDWCAVHFLPPDKPTGLRLFGHAVSWLDLALIAYPLAAAVALFVWTGSWWWFPAVALAMAFAAIMMW